MQDLTKIILIAPLANGQICGNTEYPILNQTCLISISYPRENCPKTIPLTLAHIHIVYK